MCISPFFFVVGGQLGQGQLLRRLGDIGIGVGGPHELEQLVRVLAEEGLGVVAGDVVPFDPVLVDVVEDAHAGLDAAVDVELGVVRLGHQLVAELALVARGRPGLVAPAGGRRVGGGHLDAGSGPEPPVDRGRLQVVPLAALEVAQASAGPDVGDVL